MKPGSTAAKSPVKGLKRSKQAHAPYNNPKARQGGDWHVSHSSMGMGDYYGMGVKQKLGTVRDGMGMVKVSKKKMGTPPRTLA